MDFNLFRIGNGGIVFLDEEINLFSSPDNPEDRNSPCSRIPAHMSMRDSIPSGEILDY